MGNACNKVDLWVEINALTQGTIILTYTGEKGTRMHLPQLSVVVLYTGAKTMSNIIIESEIMDRVLDFNNLYKAMLKCRRNVMWKDSTAGFVKNGLVNCRKLRIQHYNGTYQLDNYTCFKVYEPKERDIVSTRIKDRVFQRSFCDNYLYQEMTRSFIYNNLACQIGKGNDRAMARLGCMMQKYYRQFGLNGYTLKGDLKNFFGSTRHDVACAAISKRVGDEWAASEAHRVVNSFTQGACPDTGMGLGSEITQLTELAVLDGLDHFIKEQLHIRYYLRYMDDFIIFHPDKSYLKDCKTQIVKWLELRELTLSAKKTQLFPFKQSVHFLGFSYRITPTGKIIKTLLPAKISHERRKLKKLVARCKAGLMTHKEVGEAYKSWKAHAAKGNTHNLILSMDKYYKELWEVKSDVSVQEC